MTLSLLVDVEHAESGCLVGLALVLNCEKHDFVSWEAVALLFSNFKDERDQLILVLSYIEVDRLKLVKIT